jgi:hypothetical protein
MEMDKESGGSLSQILMTMPAWITRTVIVVLATWCLGSTALLLTGPIDLSSAAAQMLVIGVPLLALSLGVAGVTRTDVTRMDQLTKSFLRGTVRYSLEHYLIGMSSDSGDRTVRPPLFDNVRCDTADDMPSWCWFTFYKSGERPLKVATKCNIYNFELEWTYELPLAKYGFRPDDHQSATTRTELAGISSHPAISPVVPALRGSIDEGYSISVDVHSPKQGDGVVSWRIRTKVRDTMILSPLMRRYYAEDCAIATYSFVNCLRETSFFLGRDLAAGGVNPAD